MRSIFFKSVGGLMSAAALAGVLAVSGCKKGSAGGAASGSSGQAAKVEAKTPKEVTLAFSRAMSAGDAATAKALSTGDAGEGMIETLAQLASATSKLQKALKEKFGEAATKLEIFTESPDVADELNRSTETITGDTAVIALSPTDRNPSRLKKVGGEWKFDVTKFKESQATAPEMRKMAAAWDGLAKEVRAGKFATIDEFKKVFDERTAEAAKR